MTGKSSYFGVYFAGAIVIALIIFGIISGTSAEDTGASDNGTPNTALEQFAKCLTDNGAVLYASEWCGHCKAQKEMFGDAMQYINHVECNIDANKCQAAGIRGYPTWVVNGKQYLGRQPFSALAQATGCSAPAE